MFRLPQKSVRLLGDLERRVDAAFAELIHAPWRSSPGVLSFEPAIELRESEHEYLVVVDLPGVMPDEVRVEAEERTLVLRGTRTSEQWAQADTMVYTERLQGEFVRRIPLPAAVVPSGLQVTFAQGLLLVRLPKRPTATKAEDVGAEL
jgi:HSP20 family protein